MPKSNDYPPTLGPAARGGLAAIIFPTYGAPGRTLNSMAQMSEVT